jgi:hypothetical protein
MAGNHVSDIGERPPHIAFLGDEPASLLLRPARGLPLMVFAPRVPLRSTLGYNPAPLRGSTAQRLNTLGYDPAPLRGSTAQRLNTLGYDPAPLRGSKTLDSKALGEQHCC